MMRRLLPALALASVLALPTMAQAQSERGRPLILLVHGRGMLDRDSSATRKLWFGAIKSGAATMTQSPVIEERDVRVVWYADVLDPRSSETCDYGKDDPRARRDARADGDIKQLAQVAGGFLNVLSAFMGEANSDIRALVADASFLSDARKRCASEARLATAIERARGEGRPIILVGHSLGSLVAYDYLSTRTDTNAVQRFVTIGSMAGAPELRRLLIGGDSTDKFVTPTSVKEWVNIRNDKDPFATPLAIGRDLVTTPPPDEIDPHEMVGYLRGTVTAREILTAWCAALPGTKPAGCKDVASR